MMAIKSITPAEARAAVDQGALLVDIRDEDEHARERIPGATNIPLARIGELPECRHPVIFHCRSGMRTQANAAALESAAAGAPCFILDGGINAWRTDGLPTAVDRGQPLELMRQVQLAAGGLALAGALLGLFVALPFLWLSAFVGAGLMVAGATGWCGMARLLRLMPWNGHLRSACP